VNRGESASTTTRLERQLTTFEQIYSEANKCAPAEFSRRVFWECLHRRALPLAPFLLVLNRRYFEPDRQLIADVRRAERMEQVWEAVREYFADPRHTGWLRRKAEVRLSGRRLIRLARMYLPVTGSPPPPYPPTKA
jgi:hypothetical protein